MEIYRYGEVTSTNDIAKDLARQGVDAAVVIAESQSAGRGRRGRSFLSPAGRGLYVSVLWRPLCSAEDLLPLTAMAAASAAVMNSKRCRPAVLPAAVSPKKTSTPPSTTATFPRSVP